MNIKKWLLGIIPRRFRDVQKYDKIYHAVYGYIFFLLLTILIPMWAALISVVATGFWIEYRDKKKGGKFDVRDAIATFILALIHTIIYYIF